MMSRLVMLKKSQHAVTSQNSLQIRNCKLQIWSSLRLTGDFLLYTNKKLNHIQIEIIQGRIERRINKMYANEPNPNRRIVALVEKYGMYTVINGQIRVVYAPYFYRNPGRCFTTVCNDNTACIRPYTTQNAMLYTVPYYGDQDYSGIQPVFVPYLIVNGRIRRSYD